MSDNLPPKFIIPWEHPITQAKQDENWRHLQRALNDLGDGTRWATIVVAAHDSTDANRAVADYVCDGAGDNVEINAAIADCGTVGRVVLLEGTYILSSPLVNGALAATIEIVGMGLGATGLSSSVGQVIRVTSGGGRLTVRDLSMTSTFAAGTCVLAQFTTGSSGSFHMKACSANGVRIGVDILGGAGHSVFDSFITCSENSTSSRGLREQSTSGAAKYERNSVTVVNGRCVAMNADGSFESRATVRGNLITGGAIGLTMINGSDDGTSGIGVFSQNVVRSATVGIWLQGAHEMLIEGNRVEDCADGIELGTGTGSATTTVNNMVVDNLILRPTATAGIYIRSGSLGADGNVVMLNRVVGTGATYGIRNTATNTTVAFNDLFFSDPFSDAGSGTRTEIDFIVAASGGSPLLPSGGTTGQVLAKNSATNYDVSWTTLVNAVLALVAAKGDLLVGLGASSLARLPVDRSGQILMADATETSGVKWGPKVTIGTVAPTTPRPGDVWIDTT